MFEKKIEPQLKVKFSKTLKREFNVAFSKNAQSMGMRVLKYAILASSVYFFWSSTLFWIILSGGFIMSLLVHFWYRFKTGGWTRSYGGWDYDKSKSTLD